MNLVCTRAARLTEVKDWVSNFGSPVKVREIQMVNILSHASSDTLCCTVLYSIFTVQKCTDARALHFPITMYRGGPCHATSHFQKHSLVDSPSSRFHRLPYQCARPSRSACMHSRRGVCLHLCTLTGSYCTYVILPYIMYTLQPANSL